MQNACTVITRHETTPRGYYSGVAALFTPRTDAILRASPRDDLDAPILIRTAYLVGGRIRVPVGATLVRHSDPYGEVSETHGEAAGVLGAIGAVPRDQAVPSAAVHAAGIDATAIDATAIDEDAPAAEVRPLAEDPEIATLLASRNARLASFWLNPQDALAAGGPFQGRSAIVVDAEDRFTTMLAHQLRHLGLAVQIISWSEITDEQIDGAELIVSGPGPGDPRDPSTPRMRRMREVVARRRESGRPLLAVCLSHQILAHVRHRARSAGRPHQGLQKTVDVFGVPASIGFHNTFTARVPAGTTVVGEAEVAADPLTGDVAAARVSPRSRVTWSRSCRVTA